MKTSTSAIAAGRRRGWRFALAAGICALVAAGCGGGGGGGAALPVAAGASATAPSVPGTATTTPAPEGVNVATITVDAGPAGATGAVNLPFVSVTVCAPGSSSACQTIDHVLLDTGSSGLRLFASVLSDNGTALPPQTDASSHPYAECAQFVGSYSWGPIKVADVSLGGETAASVPVQIIGDPAFNAVPSTCANTGAPNNSVASFGSNGVLGVGVFRQDCGTACATTTIAGTYYACPGGGGECTPSTIPVDRQVGNPVARLPSDNNGVLIQLPPIPDTGARNVTGALVLGIGTRSNNALGAAQACGLDASGEFKTALNGRVYPNSFIDSGSNFFFFNSAALPNCTSANDSGFYCPASTQSLSAVNQGTNGANGSVSFSIANAEKEFSGNPSATAFNNVGGGFPGINGFDWGLPFFFGRKVFTALEGATTPGGTGPYVAY